MIVGLKDFSATVAESAAASDLPVHAVKVDATNAEPILSSQGQPETSMEGSSQEMENTPSTPTPRCTSSRYRQPPNRWIQQEQWSSSLKM